MQNISTNQQARCTLPWQVLSPTVPFSLLDKGAALNLHTHTHIDRLNLMPKYLWLNKTYINLYCWLHPIFYIYRRNQDNYSTTFTSSLTQARTPCWVVVLGLLHSSKRTRHLHCVISPWWQLKHSAKMYVGKLFSKLKLVPITSSSSNCFLYFDVQLFSLQFHCGST